MGWTMTLARSLWSATGGSEPDGGTVKKVMKPHPRHDEDPVVHPMTLAPPSSAPKPMGVQEWRS